MAAKYCWMLLVFASMSQAGNFYDENDPGFKAALEQAETKRKTVFGTPVEVDHNSFPNIVTPTQNNIDIEDIAKRYERKVAASRQDELIVFVSYSMPKESLLRVVKETSRVGGTVVLRGFINDSLKETVAAITELGETRANVVINPNSFKKYRIESVPTLVLTKPVPGERVDETGCAFPDDFIAISGDVSLGYGLEQIAKQSPQFAGTASSFLQLLGDMRP
jgi:conjugal transfer pilus assembly protein TrbC